VHARNLGFRAGDHLTESITRGLGAAVPLRQFSCQLLAEVLQMANALVDSREVPMRQREDARTGRFSGPREIENFGGLVK
jgi:hypothetical protein